MMLYRKLSIVTPLTLQEALILSSFRSFSVFFNEDIATHIESFVEDLITSLMINHRYYMIWFLTTLKDFTYA